MILHFVCEMQSSTVAAPPIAAALRVSARRVTERSAVDDPAREDENPMEQACVPIPPIWLMVVTLNVLRGSVPVSIRY